MKTPTAAGFLVRLPAGTSVGLRAGVGALGAKFELEPLFDVRTGSVSAQEGAGMTAAAPAWTWHIARPKSAADTPNAWDVAHALNTGREGVGLAAGAPILIEPDFVQSWPYEGPDDRGLGIGATCAFDDQRDKLPRSDNFAWQLNDDKSQLRNARAAAGGGSTIRIAHIDTGYDDSHATRPRLLRHDLQRNFVADQAANDAHDPNVPGGNPGHGTGTLSILAGNAFQFSNADYQFNEALGGAPDAEVIPVRVGKSVVQLLTSNIAKGINYAVELCANEQTRVHVITMSMGGLASAAWADAVNMAYEAGIIFVAAAGNNFSAGAFPFPARSIVYPARFKRVIAACGVMADRRPYYN